MVDRVKPLKFESPESGGTQTDEFPTSLDPNEDYVDARGITLQSDSSDDEAVLITRDSSNKLSFKDADNPTGLTIAEIQGTDNLLFTSAGSLFYNSSEELLLKG